MLSVPAVLPVMYIPLALKDLSFVTVFALTGFVLTIGILSFLFILRLV